MSGVYIPNWKKPESCDVCWAEYAYDICNSHSDSCPLIAVPDHHDLIDKNDLKLALMDIKYEDNVSKDLVAVFREVNLAKIIIPADKGGDV